MDIKKARGFCPLNQNLLIKRNYAGRKKENQ